MSNGEEHIDVNLDTGWDLYQYRGTADGAEQVGIREIRRHIQDIRSYRCSDAGVQHSSRHIRCGDEEAPRRTEKKRPQAVSS